MKGLTQKQQNILDFIGEFLGRQGMAPTVYEIAQHFDIKPATAFAHLRALQRKGYIDRSSKARSVTLLRGNSPKHMSLSLSVPVLGRISAGMPLFAQENKEEEIKLDPKMLPYGIGGQRLFGLRVKGESMIEAGILEGDIIIAKDSDAPKIGDIVIALVDKDEATVKKFFLTNDHRVELRPCNKTMESQFYDIEKVEIQGIVVSLYRKY